MGLKENLGRRVMILPTNSVMDFYFRQTGTIKDVVETVDVSFYIVEFYDNSKFPELVGAFPCNSSFLKFVD